MRKVIVGLGAALLFLGCGSRDTQRGNGPEAKSATAKGGSVAQERPDAESVARRFLLAMFENNAEEVKRLSLPCADQAVLWQGEPLDPAQRDRLRKQVAGMSAREALPGEALQFPDGRTAIARPPLVGEGKTALVLADGRRSLVFLLAEVDGQWRVDGGSFIAARQAARTAPARRTKP